MRRLLVGLLFLATQASASVEVVPFNVPTYETSSSLPVPAPDGSTAVTLDSHDLYIYDSGSATWSVVSGGGGGGGMVLNDPITGASANPILYGGAGGTLAQTSTFVYDYTNGRLGIGTNAPTHPFNLVHSALTGTASYLNMTGSTATGNAMTIDQSGTSATGRGMLIRHFGLGRGLEITSSNASNTSTALVVTGTHAGYGISATTSAGSAQNYTGSFGNLSTSAPAVSGGVYGSVRSTASNLTGGVIGEVIGSGIGSGFFAVRNAAGTSIGLATNLGAGVRLSPQYAMSSADNYNLEFPLVQGGAGTTLINDGAGVFSWGLPATDWASPGTIGSTTPNTGAFTTLTANRIDTTATKTTTSSETINDFSIDYAPTGALSDVNTVNIDSSLSTAQAVNSITALNMTLSSDPGSTISNLSAMSFSGNIGPTGSVNLLNITPNIESSTGINAVNLGGTWGDGQGVTAFNVGPNITSQSDGSWQLLNEGPQIAQANGMSSWSHHPDVTDVTYDYEMINAGATVDNVGRNVNTVNIHNTMTEVNQSFTGVAEGSNAGTVVGGDVTSFRANTAASVPGNAYMYTASPNITQRAAANQIVEITVEADVAGDLGGKYWRMCTAYSENPNTCFKVWVDVANGSTPPSADGDTLLEIDIAANDSASSIASAMAAVINPEAKLDASAASAVLTVEVVADGRANGPDTSQINNWDWIYTQGGGGDGYLYGYTFGAGGSSGYGENNIIAFDSGGYPVNFGKVNAFTNYTIVSSTPNPTNVHTIGANMSVGDSATVTDGDVIGVGGAGTKTTVAEYAAKAQCEAALKVVDPSDYPGHFLTSCVPKPD
jgi:hypothetical protein